MKRPMSFEQQTGLCEVTDVFYIDSIKFVTLTKASIHTGMVNADLASGNDFFSLLQENGRNFCVFELNKNYFAFWKSDDKFFIFQPMTFNHRSPMCVQLSSFECVKRYLEETVIERAPQTEYIFYTVDILKINDHVLSRDEVLKNFLHDLTGSSKKVAITEEFPIGLRNVPHKMCLVPNTTDSLDTSYEALSEHMDVLRCPDILDRVSFFP